MPRCLQSLPGLRSTTAAGCDGTARVSACLIAMTLCERCGSIRIVRVRLDPADGLVAILTGRGPGLCRRGGWRGRRRGGERDRQERRACCGGGGEAEQGAGAGGGGRTA